MHKRLNELFVYHADTGEIIRRVNAGKRWKAGEKAGSKNGQGYIEVKFDGKTIGAHRIAWVLYYGEQPPEYIDHINRIPSDNRIQNLRAATKSQNGANRKALSNNANGIKGCYFVPSKSVNGTGRWRAQCRVGKKLFCLGRHLTVEQAQAAYNTFAATAFGAFAVNS